jgi:hypothetical protein
MVRLQGILQYSAWTPYDSITRAFYRTAHAHPGPSATSERGSGAPCKLVRANRTGSYLRTGSYRQATGELQASYRQATGKLQSTASCRPATAGRPPAAIRPPTFWHCTAQSAARCTTVPSSLPVLGCVSAARSPASHESRGRDNTPCERLRVRPPTLLPATSPTAPPRI